MTAHTVAGNGVDTTWRVLARGDLLKRGEQDKVLWHPGAIGAVLASAAGAEV